MGVLKGTEITLLNGEKIKIENLDDGQEVLSCEIEAYHGRTSPTQALRWYANRPWMKRITAEKNVDWEEENENPYIIINGKLKLSYDQLVFYRQLEKSPSEKCMSEWVNAKILRKGDFLFNDKFEYEIIKSIKRIKKKEKITSISFLNYNTYFAGGYLLHNHSPCDACAGCGVPTVTMEQDAKAAWWPYIKVPYGFHHTTSTANILPGEPSYQANHPSGTDYFSHHYSIGQWADQCTQAEANVDGPNGYSGINANATTPWNNFFGRFIFENEDMEPAATGKTSSGWRSSSRSGQNVANEAKSFTTQTIDFRRYPDNNGSMNTTTSDWNTRPSTWHICPSGVRIYVQSSGDSFTTYYYYNNSWEELQNNQWSSDYLQEVKLVYSFPEDGSGSFRILGVPAGGENPPGENSGNWRYLEPRGNYQRWLCKG